MKNKLTISAVIITAFLITLGIPSYILGNTTDVYYVRAGNSLRKQTITSTGTVLAGKTSEIYITAPIVADKVLVKKGDLVTVNSEICTVDKSATTAILSATMGDNMQQKKPQNIPLKPDSMDLFGVDGIDVEELLRVYSKAENISMEREVFYREKYLSPISGTVTEVNINSGSLFASAEPAVVISDLSSRRVLAQVKQQDIDKVFVGSSATITGEGLGEEEILGTVTAIDSVAERILVGSVVEAVVGVEILLDSNDARIKPNFSVDVAIDCTVNQNSFTVPFQVIRQDESNNEYVYVINSDCEIEKRIVETGDENFDVTEILSGLTEGEIVLFTEGNIDNKRIYIKGEKNFE